MGLPAAALVKLWLAKKIVVLVAARVRVDTRKETCALQQVA
jgi:hypothetical protein